MLELACTHRDGLLSNQLLRQLHPTRTLRYIRPRHAFFTQPIRNVQYALFGYYTLNSNYL